MKCLLAICVVSMSAGTAAVAAGQGRGGSEGLRDRLAGSWRLAWLEQQGADGKPHRIDCSGFLVYTRDGHMSVQVMERNPEARHLPGPEQYSRGGYEASWGSYKVDARARTFTFHVEGALVRTLVGKDLPRAYELSGRQLIVKPARSDEHWRAAWERY